MTIAEILAAREPQWQELEKLTDELGAAGFFRKRQPEKIARFSALYRAACDDLATAESYRLPPETIRYLNELVGAAHTALYRRQSFDLRNFWRIFLFDAPRWLISDAAFWVALALFWIPFLTCELKARGDVEFAKSVVGPLALRQMEAMYSDSFDEMNPLDRISMAAFYAQHNGGIGLQCFALGALGCVPGLFVLLSNAVHLGVIFGYMTGPAVSPEITAHFIEFTTAHGPFELTAIVLSAAAGLRIGFGFIKTNGYSRLDSTRRAAIQAAPATTAAFLLFCLAGLIEAFVSPMPLEFFKAIGIEPLAVKKTVAALSTLVLVLYFGGLGGFSLWSRSKFAPGKTKIQPPSTEKADVK